MKPFQVLQPPNYGSKSRSLVRSLPLPLRLRLASSLAHHLRVGDDRKEKHAPGKWLLIWCPIPIKSIGYALIVEMRSGDGVEGIDLGYVGFCI